MIQKQIKMKKLEDFKAAKKIALSIPEGQMRRATVNGIPVNYCGANLKGRMFVVGDSVEDIQNPDCIIAGKPAREIFGEFSIMYKS